MRADGSSVVDARAQDYQRFYGLAAAGIAGGDDADFLHGGVLREHGLDFGGPDFEAGGVDHALEAVGHEKIAFVVGITDVAGAEVALAVDVDEGFGVGCGTVPVAFEELRAADGNFTAF